MSSASLSPSLTSESHSKDGGTVKLYAFEPAAQLPLTPDCKYYRPGCQVPWDIYKYYCQRYSIFSRYDDGIRLTDEAWFGVTPEPVASKIASTTYSLYGDNSVLIDAFAGAGGNTIAFARSGCWKRIIAIERDAATLACAQHNASIYCDDPSVITWVLADSFEFLEALVRTKAKVHPDLRINLGRTVIFASPPWGGPGYRSETIFDLETMQPYNITTLHSAYQAMDHVLFLPRTSDVRQIAKLVPDDSRIELVQYCMEGASKGMAAYFPVDTLKRKILLT